MSKELIERLRADAESTDDIGLCADAAERIEELERFIKEQDALRAHINALRNAIKFWMRAEGNYDLMKADKLFQEALAATPEQSLAAYRNKVIEAFVNEFSRHVGGDGEFWLHELQDFAMKELQ